MDANELGDLLLEVLPPDGSTLGNLTARQALSTAAGEEISGEKYTGTPLIANQKTTGEFGSYIDT